MFTRHTNHMTRRVELKKTSVIYKLLAELTEVAE